MLSFYGGANVVTLDTITDRLGYEPSIYSLIGYVENNILTLESLQQIGQQLKQASLTFNIVNNVPVLSITIDGVTYNFTGERKNN